VNKDFVPVRAIIEPQSQSLTSIATALENPKKDIQALTEAIRELIYTFNTYVISSLATAEDERQQIHDRVMTRPEVKKGRIETVL
jgi:hypothetical protein